MTARVSMLLKSRAFLTCFRTCFLPGRAKDFSAPRYIACLVSFLEHDAVLLVPNPKKAALFQHFVSDAPHLKIRKSSIQIVTLYYTLLAILILVYNTVQLIKVASPVGPSGSLQHQASRLSSALFNTAVAWRPSQHHVTVLLMTACHYLYKQWSVGVSTRMLCASVS